MDEKLIKIIVEEMQEKNFTDLHSKSETYSNPRSIWGNICSKHVGYYDKGSALNIKRKYERNKQFRNSIHSKS